MRSARSAICSAASVTHVTTFVTVPLASRLGSGRLGLRRAIEVGQALPRVGLFAAGHGAIGGAARAGRIARNALPDRNPRPGVSRAGSEVLK